MKSYLAAVRHEQISLGLGDPHRGTMPMLEYVVKGLKKRTAGRTSRPRQPITPQILRMLKMVWQSSASKDDAVMLWAAVCMCFFGFLRSGEVVAPAEADYDPAVHLSYGDVRVDDVGTPHYLEVRIKASKTDPFRKGISVYLGRTDTDLCPVAAILGYMVRRGSQQGPFFMFQDGRFLTRDQLCGPSSEGIASGRGRFVTICRAQFPHWRGYNCGLMWNPRLPHQDPWEMGKFCLYAVYPHPSYYSMLHLSSVGV